MVFVGLFQVLSGEHPVVDDDVLAALVEHHAEVLAKVFVVLENLVKSK